MSDAVAEQRLPMQGGLMPERTGGRLQRAIDWARRNLFSSVFNTMLTIVVLVLAGLILPPLLRWAVTHATISGMTRAACTGDGACWTFIRVRLPLFIYGRYPSERVLARRCSPSPCWSRSRPGAARPGTPPLALVVAAADRVSRARAACCCGAAWLGSPTSTPSSGAG